MAPIDPRYCPLCGHSNQCGMAAGKGNCWCFSRPIPQDVIDRIPAEARDVACVCESCAFGRRDNARAIAQIKEILSRHG